VTDLFQEAKGATPISPEEREGLIPTHLVYRRELNELEQGNILEADVWAFGRQHDPIKEAFARTLHRRMLGNVWKWAGRYRKTDKNLGVDWRQIYPALYEVMENTRHQIESAVYPADELAARFHHALVSVHPFPNGNGRWSRLMGDVLLARLGRPRFTWGGGQLVEEGALRDTYIAALREADRHVFEPLLAFVRS
jgi:Fic-DOC domain mobile mystery protein B